MESRHQANLSIRLMFMNNQTHLRIETQVKSWNTSRMIKRKREYRCLNYSTQSEEKYHWTFNVTWVQ